MQGIFICDCTNISGLNVIGHFQVTLSTINMIKNDLVCRLYFYMTSFALRLVFTQWEKPTPNWLVENACT